MTAPTYRSRCQTTGAAGEPCTHAVELERLREDMGRAVGAYSCPCGESFEFWEAGSLEEYAGLNRWLGVHVESNCLAVEDRDRLAARVNELSALTASQADEIRSLTLELARERKKRVGW